MTAELVSTHGLLPDDLDLSPSKRKLYETALVLFGQQGFHAVSIRDIAQALGQQPSAIYFHVPSKQDLLYDLALIGHRSHLESLRAAQHGAGDDPVEQLRAVVGAHLRIHLDFPSMARLTNRELGALTPEHYDAVVAVRAQAEKVTVDVLEHGAELGVFHVDDAFLTAKVIGAMGMRLPEWWTPASPRTREEILERYTGYALKLVS